jgi:hypothetical protein
MARADPFIDSDEGAMPSEQPAEPPSLGQRASGLASAVGPWLLFAALLGWGWRTTDLFHTVPAYDDVLEGLWALNWYDQALRTGSSAALYPLAFHPVGFQVPTYAWGPVNFLLLIPLNRIGGAPFAYNVATLVAFLLAFAGTYLLAQRFTSRLGATVAALLYTFWGFRWYGIIGQLNINLGSALLPWIVWSLERGLTSSRRSWIWYGLAGAIWAASVNSSLYYIWIGGFAILAWLTGWLLSRRARWRRILGSAIVVLLTAVALSLPDILVFWRASAAAAAPPFTIYDLNVLGASINSLPIPYLFHPFLQAVARSIYHGPVDSEASMANLGLLACLIALVGLRAARRAKAWRPVLVMGCLGLILALGVTLRWDDRIVEVGLLRPLNQVVWRIGHYLNPSFFFVGPVPPGDFKGAVPLPGFFLAAVVPYFAGARVLARYAVLAGLAVFLLASLGLTQIRNKWLRPLLAALLIFEVLPSPTLSFSFPPAPHPAFEWLHEQSIAPDGIVELSATPDAQLTLQMGGKAIWATLYHNQATVSGMSSVLPGHTAYLMRWLSEHPHAFQDPELIPLLRFYHIRYVILHVDSGWGSEALAEAKSNSELRYVQCFPPATQNGAWNYPICALEVLPPATPDFNTLFREGWSGPEAWGRWIDGTEGRSLWVATARTAQRLSMQAFPLCVPGREQQISIKVNGIPLTTHDWVDCAAWSAEITIPPDLVRIGLNDLTVQADYAMSPADLSGGADPDPRALSVGFTKLRVEQAD